MYCFNCGEKLNDDARFCHKCGATQNDDSKSHSDNNVAQSNNAVAQDKVTEKLLYTAKASAWMYSGKIITLIVLTILSLLFGVVGITDKEIFVFGVICIVLAVLYIAIIVMYVLASKAYRIEIYNTKIITYKGVVNKQQKRSVMTPIIGVSLNQSLNGQIWNYGHFKIDKVGNGWDINSKYIKNPKQFKEFLDGMIDPTALNKVQMFMGN